MKQRFLVAFILISMIGLPICAQQQCAEKGVLYPESYYYQVPPPGICIHAIK